MSNKNPQTGQGVPLPKKESDLFRTVVRQYENKQYKKGIKSAETILKKFPRHGETLCMKGLILNCMGKKDEAISMVKLGLMNDMRSHVCWHVYGLIYRSERNYNEAIKAYKQALRIDTENVQILRDLGLLQIQMRDLKGFTKTQHTILELKPNLKGNWLAFALGKHMQGDLLGAVEVIDIFLSTLAEGSVDLQKNFETSELAMYKNSILAEIGDYERALKHVDECEEKDIVVDQYANLKLRGCYQLQLERFDDAKATFNQLFERGSTEDYSVHTGYMLSMLNIGGDTAKKALKVKGARSLPSLLVLTDEQKSVLREDYEKKLADAFPKSFAVKRIALVLLDIDSDEWNAAICAYLQANIKRGMPSLGEDLSALFLIGSPFDEKELLIAKDPVDIKNNATYKNIVNIVDGFIESLEQKSTFPDSDEVQAPSSLLWAWYLRTNLHEMVGEYSEGMSIADKCLEQTPTGVDLYEQKARLIMGAGDTHAALAQLEKGRQLDLQDRYINNLTVKYLMKADKRDEALEKMALFTRHESDPEQNIFDMQVTWYELELAASFERNNQIGKSLKKYMAVEQHFEDFHEDQFDFHSYCIRKVTLRTYVSLLRWEDKVFGNDIYVEAAAGIIRNFLKLHDDPNKESKEIEPDYSSMNAAERKKAKAIARKKKLKKEKAAAEKAKADAEKKKKGKQPVVLDEDPDGEQLLKKDPMDEAKKYASTLVKNAPHNLTTWLLQYDVCARRGKALMALKALFKAKALEKEIGMNSEIFKRIVDFCQTLTLAKDAAPAVEEVFQSGKETLLGGKSLNDFVSEWSDKLGSNSAATLSLKTEVAKSMVSCKIGSAGDACKLITSNALEARGATLAAYSDAVAFLKGLDGIDSETEKFAELAKGRYPLYPNF